MKNKLLRQLKPVLRIAICGILLQCSFLRYTTASPTGSNNQGQLQKAEQNLIRVSGKVISADNPDGIPGVNIIIKETTKGTITDIDGNYEIDVPSNESVLLFSSIGYYTEEISVGDQRIINIELIPDIQTLDEIVVVGYGSQSKRDITGSVQTVDFEEMSEIPVAQITQKLQGRLSGVQINQYTGMPGRGMKVRIRGQASISTDSDPLYVIDGLPIVGDINSISPNEIESITILKDASSTSLYGSRAANGVVLITTKRAKTGETKIGLNAYYGFQKVPQKGRPDMMNATEFAQYKKESYEDLGTDVPEAFQNPEQYGEGTDWYEAMLRTATIQDYSLTLSQGTEKHNVSLVAGYFNQDGVLLNSGFERYSLRVNTSYNITKWLKTGINIAPTYSTRNEQNSDGRFYTDGGKILNAALLAWPILPYKNPDGSIPATAYIPGLSGYYSPNWYYTIQNVTNEIINTRILSNAFIEAEIIDGLKLKSTINADWGQRKLDYYIPSFVSHTWHQPPPQSAQAKIENDQYYTWLNENTITYKKGFGDHNMALLGGYTIQRYRMEETDIEASIFPDDRIHPIESALNREVTNEISEWSLLSYISRLTYNYKGKYLLTAAIRRDGSSRFGVNNRWGNFPSVSAGWIVSDEEFMNYFEPLSLLKLRASYGVTGNNNIGDFRHLPTVSTTTTAIFGSREVSGASPSSLGNSTLGWETTAQTDLGFDIGLFAGRIQLLYDYYDKETTNLLFELRVPQESGFQFIWSNVGKIHFWGHEIGLSTKNLVGELKWNTNFNIAFGDNKVLELSNLTDRVYGDIATPDKLPGSITKVGERIGQFYGLVWDGVYDNQDEFDNSPKHTQSQVGTIKFKDISGPDGVPDSVITQGGNNDDRTIIGNPYPKFIFGMSNDFYYKNFDLTIVISGAYGHEIARVADIGTTNLDGVFNVLRDVKDRWRSEENPGSGKYGKTTSATVMNRDWLSSLFIHDASYLTIRNITLGYNLSLENKVFKSARLYVSIQQAAVFTKYKGMNPEVSTQDTGNESDDKSQGFDFSAYPVPRTISFGFNVNF